MDDRSIAEGVAAVGVEAIYCRYLVLQQQMLLLWASQQQKGVVVHYSGRKPSDRAVVVPKLCG